VDWNKEADWNFLGAEKMVGVWDFGLLRRGGRFGEGGSIFVEAWSKLRLGDSDNGEPFWWKVFAT